MNLRWTLAALAALALPCTASAAPRVGEPPVAYVVKRGDTLHDLAARYLIGPSAAVEIQRLNRIADPRRIPIGRKLSIPAALLRSEPIVARLAAYSGPVNVQGPGAGPIRREMEIREAFVLSTGANAFLTFELPDGSRTTLPSQSRIRILRLRHILLTGAVQRDLRLEDGRSSSVVTPMSKPASRFRIETPLTVSAVRGTEFRINHDAAAARSTLEVIEGEVGEGAGPKETRVAAGFGLGVTPGGSSEPLALAPRPTLIDPSRPQDEPAVAFSLSPQAGASAYRAQIARDAGFIDILSEVTSETSNLAFGALDNGTYFARFTAIDGAGLEGLPATYAFERRLNALGLDSPTAIAGARRQYLFKWRSTGGAPERFRFVLTRADGTRAVIDQADLTERQIVVTELPPGAYSWRVLVSRREDGRLFEKWSAPQRFEIGG
jgi:hypothetical protein